MSLLVSLNVNNFLHVVGCVVVTSDVVVKAMGNMIKLCLWEPTHKALVLHVCCNTLLFVPQLSKGINDQTCIASKNE